MRKSARTIDPILRYYKGVEHDHLLVVKRAMLALADLWDKEEVPRLLAGVVSRSHVQDLLDWPHPPEDPIAYRRAVKAGLGDFNTWAEARGELYKIDAAGVEARRVCDEARESAMADMTRETP